jgi:hypothetical protein
MNGSHAPDPPSKLSDEEIRLSCLRLAVASCPIGPGQSLLIPVLLKRAAAYEAYIRAGKISPQTEVILAEPGRA